MIILKYGTLAITIVFSLLAEMMGLWILSIIILFAWYGIAVSMPHVFTNQQPQEPHEEVGENDRDDTLICK